MDPNTKKKIIFGVVIATAIVVIMIIAYMLLSSSTTPVTQPVTQPVTTPNTQPIPEPVAAVAAKFKQLYGTNYAYGLTPQQATGGGGNITYLGKAETPEKCESLCANQPWCTVYTSYDGNEPFAHDCFGMRSVPDYPGVTFTGNGATMSGVKI